MQVNWLIADRYRGGHPRMMLPAATATYLLSTEDQWNTTALNTAAAFVTSLNTNTAAAAPCVQCVPRYTYTYTDVPSKKKYAVTRGEPVTTPHVIKGVGVPRVATVRRRNQFGG
jgi:hypothetical protein